MAALAAALTHCPYAGAVAPVNFAHITTVDLRQSKQPQYNMAHITTVPL
jgi:hypothetical protein